MTEQECQQVYQELAQMLQEIQFGWVVEQVEAQIQSNPLANTQIDSQTESNTSQAVLTKPATSTISTQLMLLIDRVERAIVDSIEIKGALVDFLTDESARLQAPVTLSFESDHDSRLTASDRSLADHRSAIVELKQLLQTLRQEASASVG
ncbi:MULTISPECIES: hypothetical protein [Leptolyngbya]|uniref:hypothetical protein n=1 Tax=Leptolyngbya TaxID=47251 RepID=UPI001683A5A5|nr:hypothetical protein [Leptolyngbya sp. FACHB-1624]MBD1856199.1 hypothetical protein [Leptolyngbya sp. FACHB-1624]